MPKLSRPWALCSWEGSQGAAGRTPSLNCEQVSLVTVVSLLGVYLDVPVC